MVKPFLAVNQKLVKRGLLSYLRWAQQVSKTGSLEYKPRPGMKKKIFYVVESCLPFSQTDYVLHNHNFLQALIAQNTNVQAVARVGYPDDLGIESNGSQHTIDGVTYNFLFGSKRTRYSLLYIWQSSWVLTDFFAVNNTSVVYAATNYVHAWAALLAARRLGLPFFYEIRGLCESPCAASNYESQGLIQGIELEFLLAQQADKVFVASEDLRQYMVENIAINNQKIAIFPEKGDHAYKQSSWQNMIGPLLSELP